MLVQEPKSYLHETTASKVRLERRNASKKNGTKAHTILLPPIYSRTSHIDEIEELHKSGSEVSDEEIGDDYKPSESQSDGDESVGRPPFWKQTLRQEERMNDRLQLKRLNERTNFLPNPRLFAARTAPLYVSFNLIVSRFPKVKID